MVKLFENEFNMYYISPVLTSVNFSDDLLPSEEDGMTSGWYRLA